MRLLIAATVLAALVYATSCTFWPISACGRCEGTGKHRSPSGRAWRACSRCTGTGGRLRLGRRLWNFWRRRRAAAR